jgi:quinone-modifying oxidoreductase subunit QmoA
VAREETILVHSVIIATGWKSYPAENIKEFKYLQGPDIITNMEFERLLSTSGPYQGVVKRPSDGEIPGSIAFVQCAGSRDRNHLTYCSAVCCSASLKHALNVTESLPKASVSIFYIDLRVTGRNEDFLKRVEEEERIRLIKGKVGMIEINDENGKISIEAENIKEFKKIREEFDLVVLATGIMAEEGIPGVDINAEGFYSAEQKAGIFPVACSRKPMDVATSVKDATSAALKAMSIDN